MKQEDITQHLKDAKQYLIDELATIRTGRANTSLVEEIKIAAYAGADPIPLKELATISVPDPQSILITPWDKTILDKIEKGLIASNKGFNPINEGSDIRIVVPALTEERRKELCKEVSNLVEQSKIKIRTVRQNAIKSIEEQEDNGLITEDEMFRQKKLLEEEISKYNQELEAIGKAKNEELMTV